MLTLFWLTPIFQMHTFETVLLNIGTEFPFSSTIISLVQSKSSDENPMAILGLISPVVKYGLAVITYMSLHGSFNNSNSVNEQSVLKV